MSTHTYVNTTLQVQAFKDSGKFYADYSFPCRMRYVPCSSTIYMPDAVDIVQSAINEGKLPSSFIYYVNHPDGYPMLINHKRQTCE